MILGRAVGPESCEGEDESFSRHLPGLLTPDYMLYFFTYLFFLTPEYLIKPSLCIVQAHLKINLPIILGKKKQLFCKAIATLPPIFDVSSIT